jgi:hypothetical protein
MSIWLVRSFGIESKLVGSAGLVLQEVEITVRKYFDTLYLLVLVDITFRDPYQISTVHFKKYSKLFWFKT